MNDQREILPISSGVINLRKNIWKNYIYINHSNILITIINRLPIIFKTVSTDCFQFLFLFDSYLIKCFYNLLSFTHTKKQINTDNLISCRSLGQTSQTRPVVAKPGFMVSPIINKLPCLWWIKISGNLLRNILCHCFMKVLDMKFH